MPVRKSLRTTDWRRKDLCDKAIDDEKIYVIKLGLHLIQNLEKIIIEIKDTTLLLKSGTTHN